MSGREKVAEDEKCYKNILCVCLLTDSTDLTYESSFK